MTNKRKNQAFRNFHKKNAKRQEESKAEEIKRMIKAAWNSCPYEFGTFTWFAAGGAF